MGSIQLREGESRLCDDRACFDVALSTFGVMFAPNQETAAAELARVVRKGGRIGLANWTPDGFIGQLFKIIGKHVAPPAGIKSPALWGTEGRLGELFRGRQLKTSKQIFSFLKQRRNLRRLPSASAAGDSLLRRGLGGKKKQHKGKDSARPPPSPGALAKTLK